MAVFNLDTVALVDSCSVFTTTEFVVKVQYCIDGGVLVQV